MKLASSFPLDLSYIYFITAAIFLVELIMKLHGLFMMLPLSETLFYEVFVFIEVRTLIFFRLINLVSTLVDTRTTFIVHSLRL